jgi:hypothetical protein
LIGGRARAAVCEIVKARYQHLKSRLLGGQD